MKVEISVPELVKVFKEIRKQLRVCGSIELVFRFP